MRKMKIVLLLMACATAGSIAIADPLPVSDAAAEQAQYKRGKLLFIQCRACHELQAGQPDKIGPNLSGLLGRKVAAQENFSYSPALRAASFVWDAATLNRWIEKPGAVVPGNAMAFAGIVDPKDRAALLAYLQRAAGSTK